MTNLSRLLGGVAVVALLPTAVFAADTTAAAPAADVTAVAAADSTASPVDDAAAGEPIVVLGFGRSRQVQTVTALDIARLIPSL